MHINFKYFIVSIGSIFLALGIGILIGSNLGTNEAVEEKNASIIEDIDTKFNQLKEKNDQLKAENETFKKSISNAKALITNKEINLSQYELKDKQIGIISFNEREDTSNIETAAKNSGANIAFNVQINESILEKDALSKINEKLSLNLKNRADIMKLIANSIKTSETSQELAKLQELGYVKLVSYNGNYDSVTNFVVYTNSNTKLSDKFARLEKPVLEKFSLNKPTIAITTSTSDSKLLEKYSEMDMPSINNIDDASGRLSMIMLMKYGVTSGSYGNPAEGTVLLPSEK